MSLKRILNRIWEDFAPVDPYMGQIIPGFIKGLLIINKYNIKQYSLVPRLFHTLIIGYLLTR